MKKIPSAGTHLTSRGPMGTGGGTMLEQLEARIVLSDTYYAWTGVDTLPGYEAEYGVADTITGASDDGRFMWSEAAADPTDPGETHEPYLVVDGLVRYLRDIPALADAAVAGVSSRGVVFAGDIEADDSGHRRTFLFDLFGSGTREYLDPDLLDAPPEFDLGLTRPLAITDGGGLVVGSDTEPNYYDMWIIVQQRVTHLWEGLAGPPNPNGRPSLLALVDTNAANGVLGYSSNGSALTSRLWTPQSGQVELDTVGITRVGGLDNQGRAFALLDGQLVYWAPDAVTPILYADSSWSPWPLSADGSGRVAVWHQRDNAKSEGYYTEMNSPEGEVRILVREPAIHDQLLRFTESGLIINPGNGTNWFNAPAGGWYNIVPNSDLTTGITGDEVVAWSSGSLIMIRSRNVFGTATRFTLGQPDQFDWISRTYSVEVGDPDLEGPATVRAIVDPVVGRSLVLTSYENHYYGAQIHVGGDGMSLLHVSYILGITHAATGSFLPDQRPIVAGLDAQDHLRLFYEDRHNPYWAHLADLSEHLASRELQTPAFVGQLESFATSWGTMNIVGLDGAGDLHAVWWSPGLGSPLWTTTNLSALTGAPRLTGNLAATATPWGGMQIHGTDEQGHLVSLWWSPATGQWRATDLTAELDGPTLRTGSLDIAVGKWGSINLVATTGEGEVVSYWWSRATGWEAKPILETDDAPTFTEPASYIVAPSGQQHIAGVRADGHVVDLYWLPDGNGWQWRDLTAMATG